MPKDRLRMRPWLEQMIESKSISGVTWMDKDKTMFSIPWMHGARHGWELDRDAYVFKKWAIHTGKYEEGQPPDPKKWKANFRCAMNSLTDIEEVKNKSSNKGQQAVRVFRMLPPSNKSKDKQSKASKSKQRKKIKREEDVDDSCTQSPTAEMSHDDTSFTQENTVDSTVNIEHQDFTHVSSSEVPDWSSIIEIGSETLPNFFPHRFEVSPDHCPDYEYHTDLNKIGQQRGKDSHWISSSLDGKGFLSNEACTSPGSQWSESSSAEELDEYLTIGSNFSSTPDNLWSSFYQQIVP